MAIEVAKVELRTVQDASGLEACIGSGQFSADQVIAVIGKTEGNGGVNDFTRILADQAFRAVLKKLGARSEQEIAQIPMVWSGGCDGVITPHATVFARNAKTGPADKPRLVIGTAMSAEILPEDIGRPAMVEKVAEGVRAAMREDPDVILVGEMRDAETISMAMTAAETGHLVLGTLHTTSATKTIDRIIDALPTDEREQTKTFLSSSLIAVITQILLKTPDQRARKAVCEIMVLTKAIGKLIMTDQTHQIPSQLQMGKEYGMQLMDQALLAAINAKEVDPEHAYSYASDKRQFQRFVTDMSGAPVAEPATPP